MVKIYTKSGDQGTTSLVGGTRVSKADSRLIAYGEIDELNSSLGILLSFAEGQLAKEDKDTLYKVQNNLFIIGSHLACEEEKVDKFQLPNLEAEIVSTMEARMDFHQAQLPEIKNFILPGGSQAASFAHLGRTICRRCERTLVSLSENAQVRTEFIIFLNRLSDYLFVMARSLNSFNSVKDIIWKGK